MKKYILLVLVSIFTLSLSAQINYDDYSISELMDLGIEQYDKGNYEEAVEFFTKVLEYDELYVDAYAFRGMCFYSLENYRLAIINYNIGIELDNEYAELYSMRGTAKAEIDDMDGACSDWNRAYDLGSNDVIDLIGKFCLGND